MSSCRSGGLWEQLFLAPTRPGGSRIGVIGFDLAAYVVAIPYAIRNSCCYVERRRIGCKFLTLRRRIFPLAAPVTSALGYLSSVGSLKNREYSRPTFECFPRPGFRRFQNHGPWKRCAGWGWDFGTPRGYRL